MTFLHPAQSGFRPHYSCETALAKLIDIWKTNMENGQLNGVIFVDLRKAFDLVDTNILSHKLALYHCDKPSISWFTCYLQCLQFKSTTSSTIPVTPVAHPTGLHPRPPTVLFITFMNDLPLNIVSNTDIYTDDSSVHTYGNVELNENLNCDMVNIKHCCMDNNMARTSLKQ